MVTKKSTCCLYSSLVNKIKFPLSITIIRKQKKILIIDNDYQ